MQIKWKFDNFYKADANKVYEEIGEKSTPEEIVEKAKNPNSELHKCFEWDDSIAGAKYRIIQARTLITMLVAERTDVESSQPIRVLQYSSTPHEVQRTKTLIQNIDEYENLIARAKAELQAFKNKYATIVELDKIFESIDEFLA